MGTEENKRVDSDETKEISGAGDDGSSAKDDTRETYFAGKGNNCNDIDTSDIENDIVGREELSEYWNKVKYDIQKMETKFWNGFYIHSLTAEYFKVRALFLAFYPLLVVTTLISIMGFLTPTEKSGGGNGALTGYPLATALLGALSTLFTSINRFFGYQSQVDMHTNAAKAHKNVAEGAVFKDDFRRSILGQDLDFLRVRKKLNYYKEVKKMVFDVDLYMQLFDSIETGSSGSPVPPRIRNTFEMVTREYWEMWTPVQYTGQERPWYDRGLELHRLLSRLERCFYQKKSSFFWKNFPWTIPEIKWKNIFESYLDDRLGIYDFNESDEKQARYCAKREKFEKLSMERAGKYEVYGAQCVSNFKSSAKDDTGEDAENHQSPTINDTGLEDDTSTNN